MSRSKIIVVVLAVIVTAEVAEAAPGRSSWSTRRKPWIRNSGREPEPSIIARIKNGSYDCGGDKVVLVAAEFRGEFNEWSAERHFLSAGKRLKTMNQTVVTGRYDRKTDAYRHVVYGFYNVTRGEYGFIAVRVLPGGRSAEVINTGGRSEVIDDWKYTSWETNGRRVTIQIADDDKGGVAAIFHPIK